MIEDTLVGRCEVGVFGLSIALSGCALVAVVSAVCVTSCGRLGGALPLRWMGYSYLYLQ